MIQIHRLFGVAPLSMLVALAACAAPGSTDSGDTTSHPDASTSSGPTSLPFTVSDEFQPTGFMGDSPMDFNAITMSSDSSQCPAPRISGAVGVCYTISWTPMIVSGAPSAWVGVYWQYPANNWGTMPGRDIGAGAGKVTFAAVGAAGGEQVQFIVGGINTTPGAPDAGLSFADSFKASKLVTLTNAWATYEVPLTGDEYMQVIGGFAWSITASTATPITFYVDDIQWQP
jgi:hypothetical protein